MPAGETKTPSQARALANLKGMVMIVTDVAFARSEIHQELTKAGARAVAGVEDNIAALQTLRDSPDRWGLVICDIDVGGLRLLRGLRNDLSLPESLRAVPFIMLATEPTAAHVSDIRAAGADGVVAKPFNGAKLISTTLKVLAARHK